MARSISNTTLPETNVQKETHFLVFKIQYTSRKTQIVFLMYDSPLIFTTLHRISSFSMNLQSRAKTNKHTEIVLLLAKIPVPYEYYFIAAYFY